MILKPFLKKFITNFYLIDTEDLEAHKGEWAACEADREGVLETVVYYKTLKAALNAGKKFTQPVYLHILPVGAGIYLPVTLSYKKKSITLLVVPASGSAKCVFEKEVADYLGINLKKAMKVKTSGVANLWGAEAFATKVMMEIGESGHKQQEEVNFIKGKDTPSLLGQDGFFSDYEVVFNPEYVIKYRPLGNRR